MPIHPKDTALNETLRLDYAAPAGLPDTATLNTAPRVDHAAPAVVNEMPHRHHTAESASADHLSTATLDETPRLEHSALHAAGGLGTAVLAAALSTVAERPGDEHAAYGIGDLGAAVRAALCTVAEPLSACVIVFGLANVPRACTKWTPPGVCIGYPLLRHGFT